MGLTHVPLEIANPGNLEHWERVQCLVDSGATYSVIATPLLTGLGIQPVDEQELQLANGEIIKRKKGGAAFRYQGKIGWATVIFGAEGDMNLLGVLTLESLGLFLDPLKRELRPLPMILASLHGGVP